MKQQIHDKYHQTYRMSDAVSTSVLNAAFAAIYQKRKKDNTNSDTWLGYHFNHRGLVGLARKTIQNFNERIAAQNASDIRIQQYVRRWVGWRLNV